MNETTGNSCPFVGGGVPDTHFSNHHNSHKKDALVSVLLFCYNGAID